MALLTLEDFSKNVGAAPGTSDATETGNAQELRLNAYEEGYKAGWDDAVAAQNEADLRIGADFAKTLQEMSFSYHEARAHLLSALGPLLSAMIERVMPQIATAAFARTVIATATAMAETQLDRPLELRVCTENRPALEALTDADPGLPLTIVEDETLGPGQALIAGPEGAQEIDIDGMLAGIQAALDDFLTTQEEARRHG
ncbi:MAG: flagellar biosynthesis protein [Rhodobacteraceae bacterium]|nr:flagellar biosynthesis protein [Paracoccaceae bacterium]